MTSDTDGLHDLTPEAAIAALDKILEGMRSSKDRQELVGIDSDTAFELGYETAIFDFRHLIGPSTREVGIISFGVADSEE